MRHDSSSSATTASAERLPRTIRRAGAAMLPAALSLVIGLCAMFETPASAASATPDRRIESHPAVLSSSQLLDFLATAPIVASKPIGSGINNAQRLTLERDGITLRAAFRTVERQQRSQGAGSLPDRYLFRDSFAFEVAAYRLDRLLGLGRVPPAVLRTVDGVPGSVQLWVEEARTGDQVVAAGLQDGARSYFLQRQVMRAFDDLVYNFDRHEKNVLFDAGGYLWLIDHTRSFRRLPELPRGGERPFLVERSFYRRLAELERHRLVAELGDVLGVIEVDALWARRNMLLRHFDRLINERGEGSVIFEIDAPRLPRLAQGMLTGTWRADVVL